VETISDSHFIVTKSHPQLETLGWFFSLKGGLGANKSSP